MICIDGLKFFRGKRLVIDLETLRIHKGERAAVMGPSGGGKTTFLRLLAGLEVSDGGSVILHGNSHSESCGRVSILAQDFGLWPHLKAGEHLAFVTSRGKRLRFGEEEINFLRLVGLGDKAFDRPGEMSGGEQQRLALARALAGKPDLLLLDEPFSNLDIVLRFELLDILSEIHHAQGLTSILVTHNPEEALRFAERMLIFREGRLVQDGTWEQISSSPLDFWSRKIVEMRAA